METVPPSLVFLAGALFLGCLIAWSLVLDRIVRRQPIVPYSSRFEVPWSGIDLVLIFGLAFLAFSAAPFAAVVQRQWNKPAKSAGHADTAMNHESASTNHKSDASHENVAGEKSAAKDAKDAANSTDLRLEITPLVALVQVIATLGLCFSAGLGLWLVVGASPRDLGLVSPSPARDVVLGLTGVFAMSLPVYTIQTLLTRYFEVPSSENPVLEMLQNNPNAVTLLITMGVAVLVAPVVEEFLFRVLLQGWLEAREEEWAQSNPLLFRAVPRGSIPIVFSSLLFSLMHASSGPADPIALFPLALVLGYLYRQTHRLLPSTVMHLGFNCQSLIILWIALMTGEK